MKLAIPLTLLLIFLGSAPGAAAQQGAPTSGVPVLMPGDIVQIKVWKKDELSGDFQIAADSTIRHPLYREVKIGGMPLPAAEARVSEFLKRFEVSPSFVLNPLLKVSVGGQVRQPNLYTLAPEVTVAQAVALAGGPTERGRLDRVHLIRNGEETVVDLTSPTAATAQLPVRSGDQIFVEQRRSVFRDYVAPIASVAGALVTVVNLVIRLQQ